MVDLVRAPEADAQLGAMIGAVRRIDVGADRVRLTLRRAALDVRAIDAAEPHHTDHGQIVLDLPIRCKLRGGRTWITPPPGSEARMPTRYDPVLIRALRQAHKLTAAMGRCLADGALDDIRGKAPTNPYERRLCRLAFLAPDLQRSIMKGCQPPGINLERLIHHPIPLSWSEQRRLYDELRNGPC